MELWQLRTFRVVAETLNFTRAAKQLNLTQSAVSHQIKALETELGELLFIRAKRGVRLSESGKVVLEHAERILDDAAALRERVSGYEHSESGSVRVAAATQALVYLFAPFFESFMRAHPGIELSFRTTVSTEQTIAGILDGAADIGFASWPVYSPALKVEPLVDDELLLIVGQHHRLAKKRAVSVREIERERLVLFERGSSIRRTTDQFFDTVGVHPSLALESNDTYFIKLMTEHGWGITLLPAWAVREEVKAGKLAQLHITDHTLRRSVKMVSLGRFQPSATRTFHSFMLSQKDGLRKFAMGEPV
jgi:DNA-binding transcriptional LysR family regulator